MEVATKSIRLSSGLSPTKSRIDNHAPSIAGLLDDHARALFGYALLYGAAALPTAILANAFFVRPGVLDIAVSVGVLVEIVLVSAYAYRAQVFSAIRRHPSITLIFSVVCAAPMITDNGAYLTAYYNVAWVPILFACFAGWQLWAIPTTGIAVAAYLLPSLFSGVDPLSGTGLTPFDPIRDVAEFIVVAFAIAALSGSFARMIVGRLAREDHADDLDRLTPSIDLSPLTARELEVASLVAAGKTNSEIGAVLFLSPRTVESHVRAAKQKLECKTRTKLAVVVALIMNPRRSQSTGEHGSEN